MISLVTRAFMLLDGLLQTTTGGPPLTKISHGTFGPVISVKYARPNTSSFPQLSLFPHLYFGKHLRTPCICLLLEGILILFRLAARCLIGQSGAC